MDVSQSSRRGIILLTAVLAISALLGGWFGPTVRATAAGSSDMQDSVKSFTRVLSIVERNYADPVDVDKAIYDGAIPGMLRVLDPHSNFFDPRQYALFREEQQGKYYGVGMTVQAATTRRSCSHHSSAHLPTRQAFARATSSSKWMAKLVQDSRPPK